MSLILISPEMKDKWVDLMCLLNAFHLSVENEYVVIKSVSLVCLYTLRIALRSVGHKITEITKFFDRNNLLDLVCYKTTITNEEISIAIALFDEVITQRYIYVEQESEDENYNENETASVNVDDMDDPIVIY